MVKLGRLPDWMRRVKIGFRRSRHYLGGAQSVRCDQRDGAPLNGWRKLSETKIKCRYGEMI
jgi:hypothetical protein